VIAAIKKGEKNYEETDYSGTCIRYGFVAVVWL
jgi:hypothetical protein